jgi:hypothetical protein
LVVNVKMMLLRASLEKLHWSSFIGAAPNMGANMGSAQEREEVVGCLGVGVASS